MKKLVIVMMAGAIVLSCKKENEENNVSMQAQVDSLKMELENSQKAMVLLHDMNIIMDSIEAERKLVKIEMEQGVAQDDFVQRMQNIKAYVKKAEWTIRELEKTRSAYAGIVKKLKEEVQAKSNEISKLQGLVENYKAQNFDLINEVAIQDMQLMERSEEVKVMNQELKLIEAKVTELLKQAKVSEADAHFARAQAIEEAANRTKLAPKKRQETLQEALKYYQLSHDTGNEKALDEVNRLKTKIKQKDA